MTIISIVKESIITTDGKQLEVFNSVKVREVEFKSREGIAGRYRVPEELDVGSIDMTCLECRVYT